MSAERHYAFTGHRQFTHPVATVHAALLALATKFDPIVTRGDKLVLHTGGAIGFDTLAMATLRHFGHHILHVPFQYQLDKLLQYPPNLPDSWELCSQCGPVDWNTNPDKTRFQDRNEHMVDNASEVYAYYDGRYGGTRNCIDYALKTGVPVINILTGEIIE